VLRTRGAEILQTAAGELVIAGVTPEHPFYDSGARAWAEADAKEDCSDTIDNDCDGTIDKNDADCGADGGGVGGSGGGAGGSGGN
jgi:hypothetical protein